MTRTDDDYDVPWVESTAIIALGTLGDAIKAAQEARDGQTAQKPYPTTQET